LEVDVVFALFAARERFPFEQYGLVAGAMFGMKHVIQPRLRDFVSHSEILGFFLNHKKTVLYTPANQGRIHAGMV